jgi:predicted small metal-binding protein
MPRNHPTLKQFHSNSRATFLKFLDFLSMGRVNFWLYWAVHKFSQGFVQGKSEEEILRKVSDHAKTVHHMNEISKEFSDKVRAAIYTWF